MNVARVTRKLADQQTARLAEIENDRHIRATVSTVTPGGAGDGNALVKVTYRGGEYEVADYPDSYTPVVGHRVVCVFIADQLTLLHHSVGVTPTAS